MQSPLVKTSKEFQDNNSRALIQVWGRSKVGTLSDCVGSTAMKPACYSYYIM